MRSPLILFSKAVSVYRSRAGLFTLLALFPYVIILPLAIFFLLLIYAVLSFSDSSLTLIGGILMLVGAALFTAGAIIGQSWGQASTLCAIFHRDKRISLVSCITQGWQSVFVYLRISLLTTCITTGGFLLFIIPGMRFMIFFSLAEYVLVAEKKTGWAALLQSKRLIQKNFWNYVLRYLFIIILSTLTLLTPLFFIPANMWLLALILIIFLLIIIIPISSIYMSLMYEDLKTSDEHVSYDKSLYRFIGILGFVAILLIILAISAQILSTTLTGNLLSSNFPRRIYASSNLVANAIDDERIRHRILLRQGLRDYYQRNGRYPQGLNQLIPFPLSSLPLDPVSKKSYKYERVNGGIDYSLCTYFETRSECVSARTIP